MTLKTICCTFSTSLDSERSAMQPRFFNHPDRHGRKRHCCRVIKSHPIQGSDLAELIGQDFGPYGQRFTAFQRMQTWVRRCIHCSTPLSKYIMLVPDARPRSFIAAQDGPISNAVLSLRTPTENRFWLGTIISPSCSFSFDTVDLTLEITLSFNCCYSYIQYKFYIHHRNIELWLFFEKALHVLGVVHLAQTYRWYSCKSCSFTSRITSSAFVEHSDRPDSTEDSVDGCCCLWVEGVCTRTCASLRSLKPSPSAKMPVCWNWRHWKECDLRQCLVCFYVTEWIGWKWNQPNKLYQQKKLLVFEFHHVKLSGNSYWFMDDERTKTGSL